MYIVSVDNLVFDNLLGDAICGEDYFSHPQYSLIACRILFKDGAP